MKRSQDFRVGLGVCVTAVTFAVAGACFAQAVRPAAGGAPAAAAARGDKDKVGKVTIKRMPPPNKTSMVRTPEFGVNVQNTVPKISRRPREWALFEIKYETEARWMDELAFSYHVMTKGRNDEGKDVYSYYTTSLRYIDIPKGEHMSCVALPPSLVERYGEPVAIALEIVGKDGTVLASQSESNIPLPQEWWRNSQVLDNASLTRRNGLVDRSKTPFALVNADDYEVVQ